MGSVPSLFQSVIWGVSLVYSLVLCGHATLGVDGEELLLHQNSLAIVEPGEIHRLNNASEDFEVIVVMEKYVPDDKIIITDE